jgi:hypothetical protein
MSSDIKRYRDNLRDELNGAALYAALAAAETDPLRKDLFLQLAQRFGPRFVLPTVAAAEFADRNKYAGQSDAHAISAEERGHAAVIQAVAANSGNNGTVGADIARAEPWHRGASGNNLRAAILGANDGLVSNFCLIMGVAGAGSGNKTVLLTGLAGLAAGACSMALGEWLSVTNARELAQTQIAREAEELEQTPLADLVCVVLRRRDFSGGAVLLDAWTVGDRGKCARQWRDALRRGHAVFAVQRPQSLVFRGPSVDLWLPRGRDHVWNRSGAGHDAVVKPAERKRLDRYFLMFGTMPITRRRR